MAQHTIITQEPEIEIQSSNSLPVCRHHWVIQPADGPISIGSCQICGVSREFKNYVESATWGDSRGSSKGASVSVFVESSSDDEYMNNQDIDEELVSVDDEIEIGT